MALAVACFGPWAAAQDPACHTNEPAGGAAEKGYTRTLAAYEIPQLTLVNQEGQEVDLAQVLQPAKPVAVNFIFTTCTTICPVMTATFSKFQRELGEEADTLRLVSISIDPEYDTPARLKAYAEKFNTGEDWHFLTGNADSVTDVLRSFNALSGSKMSHKPFTLFKLPDEEEWVRIDGLTSASILAAEYRRLIAN